MSAEIISIIQFLLDSPLVKWLLIFGIASLAITKGEPTSITDIDHHYEERQNVLDALEYEVLTVDMAEGTIYCER